MTKFAVGTIVVVKGGVCFFERVRGMRHYPAKGTRARVFRISDNNRFWLETLDGRFEACGVTGDLDKLSALEQLALQSED